jgi:alginate O-acetyltransferase complex protein AlgI
MAVVVNIGLLVAFKYTGFLAEGINATLAALGRPGVPVPEIALPIGISFFTFHALSYVIDIYRRDAKALRNPFDMGLYIALFSQLVAGPIIRFHDIAHQLRERRVDRAMFARGVERFVIGLGKKVLIANSVAVPADLIFSLPPGELTPALAWLGVLCYALQIYFDFSGYSDMAIGLGLMFGFRFLENFNYPYISQSVTEFWRRWHISLSTWFRDYLYIPLGGNRGPRWRVYRNLIVVFVLCGLWHGASLNFLIWGLYYGVFLVIERMGFGRALGAAWAPLRHAYLLLVVAIGWVFFRADTLPEAQAMLSAMAGLAPAPSAPQSVASFVDRDQVVAIVAGCIGAMPLLPALRRWLETREAPGLQVGAGLAAAAGLALILGASAMLLATGTYNPFIYFRF